MDWAKKRKEKKKNLFISWKVSSHEVLVFQPLTSRRYDNTQGGGGQVVNRQDDELIITEIWMSYSIGKYLCMPPVPSLRTSEK